MILDSAGILMMWIRQWMRSMSRLRTWSRFRKHCQLPLVQQLILMRSLKTLLDCPKLQLAAFKTIFSFSLDCQPMATALKIFFFSSCCIVSHWIYLTESQNITVFAGWVGSRTWGTGRLWVGGTTSSACNNCSCSSSPCPSWPPTSSCCSSEAHSWGRRTCCIAGWDGTLSRSFFSILFESLSVNPCSIQILLVWSLLQ